MFNMLMGAIGFILLLIIIALTWEWIAGFFAIIALIFKILLAIFIIYCVFSFIIGFIKGLKE